MNEVRRNPITRRWIVYLKDWKSLSEIFDCIQPMNQAQADKEKKIRQEESHWDYHLKSNPHCKYCAGNERQTPPAIRVMKNKDIYIKEEIPGWQVRVIPNPNPLFKIEGDLKRRGIGWMDVMNGRGAHEVIIESPTHRPRFENLPQEQIVRVLASYRERFLDLENDANLGHLYIFKNQMDVSTDSFDHPHSELIASPMVGEKVRRELDGARIHYQTKERCIFCDLIYEYQTKDSQIIFENKHFIALIPLFASKLFEIWVLPKQHEANYKSVEVTALDDLAEAILKCLTKLRKILSPLGFSMLLFSSPNKNWGDKRGYWATIGQDYHWHFKIIGRFLSLRELTSHPVIGTGLRINPVLPEIVAKYLRDL
jgi:UDPglucose--hexose-1-phosphate uridylyltransferase